MRSDFAALVLTHGRPDRQHTVKSLRRSGYTGRIILVLDDEDTTIDRYRQAHPDLEIEVFSKAQIASEFDEADNFLDRRSIFYARNASWAIAKKIGVRYFVQLDDDYLWWCHRYASSGLYMNARIRDLDAVFEVFLRFLDASPSLRSVAMSQGGDHIGGAQTALRMRRKAMNTFFCDVKKPFAFHGRVNEDVSTYVLESQRGGVFATIMSTMITQPPTQSAPGGMSEMYLGSGTYLKTFYSVLHAPSSVQVGAIRDYAHDTAPRIHHEIDWHATSVKILSESHRQHG